jgi:hypothetical protein
VSARRKVSVSASEKVIRAKSILQAVIAAENSGELQGENYDMTWPLRCAVEMLEDASLEVDEIETRVRVLERRTGVTTDG